MKARDYDGDGNTDTLLALSNGGTITVLGIDLVSTSDVAFA